MDWFNWVLLCCVSVQVAASPSINIALKASFDAGPYLVELLETAAQENSTSYFPILDTIADGVFAEIETEEALFEKFLEVVRTDGHIEDPDAIASFKFALAIRSAAPRIEAHYQFYNTSVQPNMMAAQDAACPVWVHLDDKQYCSPALEIPQQDMAMAELEEELPFDRLLGGSDQGPPSILYADITHPLFGHFHKTVSRTAKEGRSSYRVRYRPSTVSRGALFLTGFGVELALKRTDYIVIDDRKAAQGNEADQTSTSDKDIAGRVPADLKPLTTSELERISINAASYVMSSNDPLDTLIKVSADFPRYSAIISSHNASTSFLSEHNANRAAFLPQGYSIIWINGLQLDPRSLNVFDLLDHLRRERSLVSSLRRLGLTASQAIGLLSHEHVAQAQVDNEPQRYDWRDQDEGGQVIVWLNDIEKDTRYQKWPSHMRALLQRTYPGQLPTVRRDLHNLVVPVDLSDSKDLLLVVDFLQSFVKRAIPVRFGLVPTCSFPDSVVQARIAYHLIDTYGLGTLLSYLEKQAAAKKPTTAAKASFVSALDGRQVRDGRQGLDFEAVAHSEDLGPRLEAVTRYVSRLMLSNTQAPVLMNGVVLPRNDNWFEAMSSRLSMDLRTIQRAVAEEQISEDSWIPDFFLKESASRRNALIIPEDLNSITILDISKIAQNHADILDDITRVAAEAESELKDRAYLLLIADLDEGHGKLLLEEAITARRSSSGIELVVLHNPKKRVSSSGLSFQMYDLLIKTKYVGLDRLSDIVSGEGWIQPTQAMAERAADYWTATQRLVEDVGLDHGASGILLNGRFIGPIKEATSFMKEDFQQLLAFELKRRSSHVVSAISDMRLGGKVKDPLDLAIITSLLARAHISTIPEGIFESPPLIRMNKFKLWNDTHSAIHVSTAADPALQIVAAVDVTSEAVQQWLPVLKILSELHGVDVKIFLNPRDRVLELPIKRFYRQALDSAPRFDDDGSLRRPQATFTGIPDEALLNLGMDVPSSWLVAPQVCEYDLDNIQLSSVPKGENIDAIYELEHILIQGHSREISSDTPPQGVQLLLGSRKKPHFADTIIMANLGYFQFKANPGHWHISLMPGRSSDIFTIDSVGGKGYSAQPGDETRAVALYSFHGATIYPRLSRKAGKESEDVLESGPKPGSAMDYLNRGASFASSVLSSVGLFKSSSSQHADINIFSVASGHLYERMLNIMMLSVMKYTNHSVKFWFIEQFLSPSFKSSLPHLASHYNFSYELVTFKWPHWLRRQKEKQREIWGYKILFLDVLFPLDLNKVIFVDADQIVRTDLMGLNEVDLHGAPYGFTPMCDSRTEMEGFRFWKQGYWQNFLDGKPYHISALYVVDLQRFRQLAAGDRLRQQYHALSADPASLSNLDQDLPNHMQHNIPIFSLAQEWLWCETWCDDASLARAKTIDLCNNPLTKEPKLERARRQVPEWTVYDEEIARVLAGVGSQGDTSIGRDTGIEEGEKKEKERKVETKDADEEPTKARKRNEL